MTKTISRGGHCIDVPTPQFQLDFITYLQRLFVEGDFSATYKFALLYAFADLCYEKQDNSDRVITLDQIAEKIIEMYWHHSLPYNTTKAGVGVLLQNNRKQITVLNYLIALRKMDIHTISSVKKSNGWVGLIRKTKSVIKRQPLILLQKLQGEEECFLYSHVFEGDNVVLNEGVVFCFKKYYDLVTKLIKGEWLNKIRKISDNRDLLGDADLESFLFKQDRASLQKVQVVLLKIQKEKCFYCGNKFRSNERGEVDHFIPWSRYSKDLGHNFVLAHASCNKRKSDNLVVKLHLERWFEQNIIRYFDVITTELDDYFICDRGRSVSILLSVYELANSNGSKFWYEDKKLEEYDYIPSL